MDGVRPVCVSSGMAVGVLLLACSVQCVWSCPAHPTAVLLSIAVVSCIVLCGVCGAVRVSACLCCSCGGVSSVCSPPLAVVEGAAIAVAGCCCGGGWHSVEGRVLCWCPSRLVLVSPFRLCGGPVGWRRGCVVVMPRVRMGLTPCIVLPHLAPPPFSVFAVTVLLIWGASFLSGLCHCGMAVMV